MLTIITDEPRMSVAYHNKPCEAQVVFLFGRWPSRSHSGTQVFSLVDLTSAFSLRALFIHQEMGRRVEKQWVRFSWTRTLFLYTVVAQNSIAWYTQLQGSLGRCSTCGPKKKRKLHSSSRIKNCHLLLLSPLLELPPAGHQVLLVFILWWLSSLLLYFPCHPLLCIFYF